MPEAQGKCRPVATLRQLAEADKGYASAYDTACRQLVDLRDAYHQQAMSASFQTELQRFLNKHRHRKALMTRLQGRTLPGKLMPVGKGNNSQALQAS